LKNNMFDIITLGSATQDIMVRPKNLTVLKYGKSFNSGEGVCFPLGSKIDIDQIQFTTGGGGTNTAVTFALQGFAAAFCGMIGKDISGQRIIDELQQLKVDVGLVVKTADALTNHSIIITGDSQDKTILAYRGAGGLMGRVSIPWQKLKTKWLYLAPLTGLLCDSFGDLVDFAAAKNMKVAVNPSIAQLSLPVEKLRAVFQKVAVLILNQEEASFLSKIPYEHEKEIFTKIGQLHPGITVMTRGGDGVVVSDGKFIYSAVPPKDRSIIDTTGAGDSFASGFLSDYIRTNGDIEKSIQLGMANALGCLSEVGAKNGLLKKGQEFEKVEVKKREIVD